MVRSLQEKKHNVKKAKKKKKKAIVIPALIVGKKSRYLPLVSIIFSCMPRSIKFVAINIRIR